MSVQKFKVENGIHVLGEDESLFEQDVVVNGDVRVNGNVLFVNGNLRVNGATLYTSTVIADIVPGANSSNLNGDLAYNLGSPSKRWQYGYFGNVVVSTAILGDTNNVGLGNMSNRFNGFFTNVYASGNTTFIGNSSFNTNAFVVDSVNKRISVNATPSGTNALTVGGTSAMSGNVAVTGQITATANITGTNVILTNGGIFTNSATINSGTSTTVDGFSKLTIGAAKYLCYVYSSSGNIVQANELLVVHNGTLVFITRYGDTFNTKLGDFDADISGDNVLLKFTNSATPVPNSSYTYTVKTIRQQLG